MILENIVVGITQLVIAIILAVVGLAMGFQIFGRLTIIMFTVWRYIVRFGIVRQDAMW